MGQVVVDVLVGVDVPLGDVHAHPHRGVDLGGIDVGKHDGQHGPAIVVGFSGVADGQDVGRLKFCLDTDESVGLPDVGHALAGHVEGCFEWHGDRGGRGHSGLIHESSIHENAGRVRVRWTA